MLERPILADQPCLVLLEFFAGMQAPQDIRNHGWSAWNSAILCPRYSSRG